MSSFFDLGCHKMFNVRNRLGMIEKKDDDVASQPDSWVELAPSRQSLCSSVDNGMCSRDERMERDSKLKWDSDIESPMSLHSPHVEFESLEAVKYKLVRDMLPPGKNTDWIWEWSSRPETIPPKSLRMRQYGSNLTTPPNSPEPELLEAYPVYDRERRTFSPLNIVIGVLVSNIVTFVIGAAIGFVVCKRLARKHAH